MTSRRDALVAGLGAALLAVAALTLRPSGVGWTWASPLAELRWYATGLESSTTLLQLLGNLRYDIPSLRFRRQDERPRQRRLDHVRQLIRFGRFRHNATNDRALSCTI